ncbi:MAG: ABC transporter ATP-binding protein [Roseiflexaceae bacterium]|nr:ABC transporter ATP-binding protein [Roseiflexaceae bacterium]
MSIIQLRNLAFTYQDAPQPALRDVTVQIERGELLALIGRAGAGKTTFCTLLAGFMPQFFSGQLQGSAFVDGLDVLATPIGQVARSVGLVSANPAAQISGARFTVFEEIAFGLENIGLPPAEIVERVTWALGALDIAELRERSPYALSGGQQQRLAIAAALALRPPVLVLDEPIAQLDPRAARELAQLLRSLAAGGTTIVIAEHRLKWVTALADRTLALERGRVIANGTPAEALAALAALPAPQPARLAAVQTQPNPFPALQPIVQAEAISYRYPSGVAALQDITFSVSAGERIAMLGRNGAGKSTLVRHLNGLLPPASGRVLVAGNDTRRTSVAGCARHVGLVFQDVRNQLFARSVREELRFGPRMLRRSAAEVELLVDSALDTLGLRELAGEHPYDLPPATRRLVAIAAVLAMAPPLLVLDEPTSGLDTLGVTRLIELCLQRASQGVSTLLVTHDLDFARQAAARVIVLDQGRLALDSSWDTLDANERAQLAATVGLPVG